jgi:iron complex outermembrane recepter protein
MSKLVEAALAGAVAAGFAAGSAAAQAPQTLPPVVVKKKAPESGHLHQKLRKQSRPARPGEQASPVAAVAPEPYTSAPTLAVPLAAEIVRGEALRSEKPALSDTASLLAGLPGVNTYAAGGVSNLPVVNGFADERIGVELNGMLITSACANHMNAPLSYTDPTKVGSVEVTTAVSPVSKGGDAIGGRIIIENAPSNFATAPGELLTAATLSSFFRSNGNSFGASAAVEAATQNVSIRYNGSWSRSDDYERGGGEKVLSTQYEAANHALTLTARNGGDLFTFQGGLQLIPGQAYVNQFMDMVDNTAYFFNTRYQGRFEWGTLDARAFYQHTNHEMGFLPDKPGLMPMKTEGQDFGYSVKAEIPVSYRDTIRIGNEFHGQTLDDWWPPVSGSMMMGPLTYWNINGGMRDRIGTFAEWERRWTPAWSTLLGARNDVVWMDTGDVQPYNWADPIPMGGMGMGMGMANPDAGAAVAFNARSHARTDVNFDLTALARFEPNANETFEAGYARKTRSPSLYERYAWGTGDMSSSMVGWFGDLNGYVGNLDLKREVAHTVSVTAAWRGGWQNEWEAKVTPYYSYVEDFIDVDRLQTLMNGNVQLQFANHDAQLFGVNLSGKAPLWANPAYGRFAITGLVSWVEGERIDGGNLYHMMPLNGRFALTHALDGWSSAVDLQLVSDKDLVDLRRNEPTTPGYALLNLRTRYEWQNLRVDLSVENLFDKLYYQPLGGAYRADFKAPAYDLNPVAGMGRSFNAALTVKF